MIKFFRRIRQSLLSEGKTGKPGSQTGRYFKYAIGEIILVVLGILIALQINNWNVQRINNIEEKKILESLQIEIAQNQLILTKALESHAASVRSLIELNDLIAPQAKDVSDERFDSLIYRLASLPTYTPQEGVLNSILSSGKISLISNDELNSKLASWHTLMKYYDKTLGWNEQDVFDLVLPYIKEHYPLNRTLKIFVSDNIKTSKFKFSKQAILSDMAFESIVSERIIDANAALKAAKDLFNFQNDILELISKE